MKTAAVNLVKWLRECFREDRARSGVRDMMSSRVLHRHVLKGVERLASGELPEIVLSPTYAEKAAQHAALYRREQEVVYACLFVCGLHDGKPCRAPLVLYQAEFSPDNHAAISIEISRWRINPRVLEMLEVETDELSDILSGGQLDEGVIGAIRDLGQRQGVNVEPLWQWPELASKKKLDEAAKKPQLSLHPASVLGLLPRSISTRGVIDELDLLAAAGREDWSLPLRVLLGVESMLVTRLDDGFLAVPALLSKSQQEILQSSRHAPITLCHGPPGTGKSFTIAAIALNHVARGQSVLIASRKNHAVDVVQEKIETMLGGEEVTVRAGRRDHLSKLKRFMEACLAGQMTTDAARDEELRRLFSDVKQTMRDLHADELDLEKEWSMALARGEVMAKPNPNLLEKVRRFWIKTRVKGRYLLLELTAHLNDLYVQRERQLGHYIRMQRRRLLKETLNDRETRKDFKNMLSALRKYRGSEQEQVFAKMDVSSVLRALPVWLTNLDDLHRVLPMEKELFDVAIIDESSQCDLASVLPLLQRAKRVVIAGDTRQLRHISFLSKARQTTLAGELGVTDEQVEVYNYRDVSLMDHAAATVDCQRQIGFLNEHFRSSPRIIAFSNNEFYQGALQIMRERPWEDQDDALRGISVEGVRDENGVNAAEVDAVLRDLRVLYHQSFDLPVSRCPSAGILSPFRNQVEAIRARVQEEFSQKKLHRLLEAHRLLIGTAHTFQGEERDVMFISFGVDAEAGRSTLRFIERPDVFNVSITRAKSMQRVYHSLSAGDLSRDSLLGRYLMQLGVEEAVDEEVQVGDAFMHEVADEFRQHGIEVRMCQRVAGVSIDLMLLDGSQVMGLDLIGYPGESYPAVDLHRLKILRRAGFRLLPLGYTEWKTQRSHAVSAIIHELRYDTRYYERFHGRATER